MVQFVEGSVMVQCVEDSVMVWSVMVCVWRVV